MIVNLSDYYWHLNSNWIFQPVAAICWVTKARYQNSTRQLMWRRSNDVYIDTGQCAADHVTCHFKLVYHLENRSEEASFFIFLFLLSAVHHHKSAVETRGGAADGEEPYQVKLNLKKKRRASTRKIHRLTTSLPPHQSNRILSAQTRMLWQSVCGNASAPLVGFQPAL